jgi:hypothetical protein
MKRTVARTKKKAPIPAASVEGEDPHAIAGRWLLADPIPRPVSQLIVGDANQISQAVGQCRLIFSAIDDAILASGQKLPAILEVFIRLPSAVYMFVDNDNFLYS